MTQTRLCCRLLVSVGLLVCIGSGVLFAAESISLDDFNTDKDGKKPPTKTTAPKKPQTPARNIPGMPGANDAPPTTDSPPRNAAEDSGATEVVPLSPAVENAVGEQVATEKSKDFKKVAPPPPSSSPLSNIPGMPGTTPPPPVLTTSPPPSAPPFDESAKKTSSVTATENLSLPIDNEPRKTFGADRTRDPADFRPRIHLADIKSFPKDLLGKDNAYTIDDEVIIGENYYLYHVRSPHGEFDVKGTQQLKKLCHEIKVIESFRNSSAGQEVLVGMKKTLLDIPRGAANLVIHPVSSVKALGRHPARLVRGIGRVVKKPFHKKDAAEKNAKAQKTASGANVVDDFFVTGAMRSAAAELGVDAYSNNPNIRALLLTLGRRRTIGSIATAFMLPTPLLLTVSTRSLTPGGMNVEVERLITENGKAEMKRLNAHYYKVKLGRRYKVHQPITRLLDNPYYTPRQQAYFRYYLEQLGNLPHLDDVINYLAACSSVDSATLNASQLELIYLYHERVRKVRDLFVYAGMIGLVDEAHKGVYMVPFDYVAGTPSTREWITGAYAKATKEFNADPVEVWITGDSTRGFAVVCSEAKMVLRHRILEAEVFRD